MNIEDFAELATYLRGRRPEPADFHVLSGGVSNRTVLVRWQTGEEWVLKQALPKLRVASDWRSDPKRVHREAEALRRLGHWAPPGSITPFVFEDQQHDLLAMQAVPQPHENWKQMLLSGRMQSNHLEQYAIILANIHSGTFRKGDELMPIFGDLSFFESLRLEPYYLYAAQQVTSAAEFLYGLKQETTSQRWSLVHGDYSPKNILVCADRLILLDHEVVHFGDPAFDIGFALTHLLSKAHHLRPMRGCFSNAADKFWRTYLSAAGEVAQLPNFESRAVRHTLACLLARVAGRSPLEYLNGIELQHQQDVVLDLIRTMPESIPQVVQEFEQKLRNAEN